MPLISGMKKKQKLIRILNKEDKYLCDHCYTNKAKTHKVGLFAHCFLFTRFPPFSRDS